MDYEKEKHLIQAEIDLGAIAHNVSELKRVVAGDAGFMAVVKANAYGHGLVKVAQTALESGADCLGVARLSEAEMVREAGISAPVLIFGYTPPSEIEKLNELDLIQTIYSLEMAQALSGAARRNNRKIRAHLKLDTGMGRLGIIPDPAPASALGKMRKNKALVEVLEMAGLPGICFEGIYTHFASSDAADKRFAETQFQMFMDFIEKLHLAGLEFPTRHAANSGAIIDLPETHLDLVRAGISLYGLYPSDSVDLSRVKLKPAMTVKSSITHIKQVPSGFAVSYNSTYVTDQPTTVATVPVGYGDGYNRLLSNKGRMLVGGCEAPVIGRVCMDQTLLDVGHIPDVALGDEVIVYGRQDDLQISVDDVARMLGTINYEVVCAVSARVPRVYI